MVKKYFLKDFGYEVELGKFANQADGSVWIKQGGTVVLATAVSAKTKEFPGFLPLTVDYREQFSAGGKIPGGYFKREGKSTDKEVLTSRLIDRALRPIFPARFFDSVQVLSTVYSFDKKHMPAPLALVASSLALVISKIPFLEPVGAIEVVKHHGEWIFNPNFEQSHNAEAKIVVAGTQEGVCMLEGSAKSVSENELLDVIFKAHEHIKKQIAWQNEIQKDFGQIKESLDQTFNWDIWEERANNFFTYEKLKTVFKASKQERNESFDLTRDEFFAIYKTEISENNLNESQIDYAFDSVLKSKMTELILKEGKRIDGRSYDKVRDISVEVGLLPFAHGSALFKRGGTQALVTATLGSGQDVQKVDELIEGEDRTFILHYNFPPFSVGEVKPLRGPGRREVGHGFLAVSALKNQLPSQEEFPYTIRIVSDILSSDGSSSMATVCGSTMALMNAGVPIKNMVSGVAMGLLKDKDKYQAITDITGFEDEFGWMDFKVTGIENGITAIQLDIKNKGGLPKSVFEEALQQAKSGRIHILNEMRKCMSAPSPQLSAHVPKITSFKIDTDKIGAVIGGGGKVIREIIDKTKTTIDIEDDGTVKIFGGPEALVDLAINWVKTLAGKIDVGAVYDGKVKRTADFGIFVEIVPGMDGLIHMSTLPKDQHKNFYEVYKPGQDLKVEVLDYDSATGRIRLRPFNK